MVGQQETTEEIRQMQFREYRSCRLCPRACGADRYRHAGYCGCAAEVKAARAGLHYYEEPFLSGTRGSGTVFFTGCSLGCVYCQNGQISRELYGYTISEERLTEIFLEQQDRQAHNINLVTGTQYIPSIAAALREAKQQGLSIPVIWNSSGYERPDSLRQLEGLVDIFLPDFKTLDPVLGKRYMNAPDYPEWAKASLACMYEMAGTVSFAEFHGDGAASDPASKASEPVYEGENVLMKQGLVVRHLVIPGQTEDSRKVLRYLFETYGDHIWISLMSQYTPTGRFAGAGSSGDLTEQAEAVFPELYRKVSSGEYEEVVDYAIELGIENCMIQEGDAAEESFIPAFDGTGINRS